MSCAATSSSPATIAPPPAAAAAGSALAARLPPALASVLAIPGGSNDGSVSVASVAAAQAVIAARPGSRRRPGRTRPPSRPSARPSPPAGLDLRSPPALGPALGVNPGPANGHRGRAHRARRRRAGARAVVRLARSADPLHRRCRRRPAAAGRPRSRHRLQQRGPNANGLYAVIDARDAIGALAALQAYPGRGGCAHQPAAGAVHHLALRHIQRPGSRTSWPRRPAPRQPRSGVTRCRAAPTRRRGSPSAADRADPGNRPGYVSAPPARHWPRSMGRFDPLFDVSQAAPLADPASGNGEQALAAQRAVTEQAWQAFSTATSATFDGLIAALGQPGLVSSAQGATAAGHGAVGAHRRQRPARRRAADRLARAAVLAADVAVDVARPGPASARGLTGLTCCGRPIRRARCWSRSAARSEHTRSRCASREHRRGDGLHHRDRRERQRDSDFRPDRHRAHADSPAGGRRGSWREGFVREAAAPPPKGPRPPRRANRGSGDSDQRQPRRHPFRRPRRPSAFRPSRRR